MDIDTRVRVAPQNGHTPLHRAAIWSPAVCEVLIQNGAEVDAVDKVRCHAPDGKILCCE